MTTDEQEIEEMAAKLAAKILETLSNLADRALAVDGDIADLLQQVGKKATEKVLSAVASEKIEECKQDGFVVEKHQNRPFFVSSDE